MKLPISLGQSKEKKEFFLGLVLKNEKAISVIFEKIGSTIKYISSAEEEFKSTIEDAELEEFLDVLDKAITQAETALPENIETHKTIFGLKESWIEADKIKKEYLDKLKKASDELSLEPIGFLGATESIINLIQKEEGAPATAILADLGKRNITVTLLKAGKIVETKTAEIHQSAPYTVDTLLKHFTTPEVMPPRIILLGNENEDLTQEFLGHSWSKSLPFLHLPQITSLEEDASVKAMLLGATTQMGTNLSYDSTSVNILNDEKTPAKKITSDNFVESSTDNLAKESATETKLKETESNLDFVDQTLASEVFGFVEGADVAKNPVPKNFEPKISPELREEKIQEAIEEVGAAEELKTPTTVNAAFVTTRIKKFVPIALSAFKKIKLNGSFLTALNLKGNKLLLIPLVLILLLIVVTFIYLSGAKANVDISVSSKGAEKSQDVTFTSQNSTDVSNNILSAGFPTVSEDGSVTIPTTGKKDEGNPAKGTVTIFNNDSQSISFNSGTKIQSPNGLYFTLDNGVTVASAAGDIFSGTTPGTTSVTVTAADIGQDYNLPSGTKFSIGGSDTAAAKNDNAFSGGSKTTVTVVSKDDIQKILDTLPKQLESKAKSDINSKGESGKTILSSFVDETVSSSSFDKKVDDQVSQITLKGTVDFTAVSYNDSDILAFATQLFDSSNLLVSKQNLDVTAKNLTQLKNKDVTGTLDLKVKLLPKIDTTALAEEIKGAPLDKAKNLVLNLPQVQNVDITIKPSLPFISKNLPGDSKNIIIKVTSN